MYFWKIDQLKNDIKSGQLTEKDRFIYFFIYVALETIFYEISFRFPAEDENFWDYAASVLSIIIQIIGTFIAYKANNAGNGIDFLGKFFSLGFVACIRFLTFSIPFIVLYIAILANYYYDQDEVQTSFAMILPGLVWLSLWYWYFCKHIMDVRCTK